MLHFLESDRSRDWIWMWIWANSERQWQIGKPGVLQSAGSQRVRQDLVTEQHHCLFLSIGPATLGIFFIGGLIPALPSWCLRKSHVSLVEEALGFSVGSKKPAWECFQWFPVAHSCVVCLQVCEILVDWFKRSQLASSIDGCTLCRTRVHLISLLFP